MQRMRLAMFAVPAVFFGASALAVSVFVRDPISIRPVCAFGDGIAYCNAAMGRRVGGSFSRRPVVPAIAGLFPTSLGTAFRTISVVSLLLAAVLAVLLGIRIAKRLNLVDRASHAATGFIIVGVALVAPHGLRLAWSVPVLVDEAALAAGLLWLLLFTSDDSRICVWSIPAAFLAGCTREVWGPVIVVTALAALALRRRPVLDAANAIAAAAAYFTATRLVPSTHGLSESDFVRYSWHQNFSDVDAIRHTVWAFIFAVGLMGAVLVLRQPFSWIRRELAVGDITGFAVLLTVLLLLGSSLLTGSDLTRYLYPAGTVLITLAAPWLVAHRELWIPGAVLAIGTIVVWDPLHHLIASEREYVDYYYGGRIGLGAVIPPTARTTRELIVATVAFAIALLVMIITVAWTNSGYGGVQDHGVAQPRARAGV